MIEDITDGQMGLSNQETSLMFLFFKRVSWVGVLFNNLRRNQITHIDLFNIYLLRNVRATPLNFSIYIY